ncbi:unnamed protein product [Oncorhynchus mykiss]|uniref:WWE domain-containing protein n=1 Tax=Oncorhynchus mykiss TaxID=8022 RepID=A0A060XX19_ONCMY|nr:unnamed protein product [Oncorhynchus mykiss]
MNIYHHTWGQKVYIDLDQIEAQNAAMSVRRLTFLPQAQSEDIGWYFKDDLIWREYGSLVSQGSSSVSSGDVERQYILRPQGTFHFTVGSTSYTLDFTAMTQTNSATRVQRKVRQRPNFNSVVSGNGRYELFIHSLIPFRPLVSSPRKGPTVNSRYELFIHSLIPFRPLVSSPRKGPTVNSR